MDIEDNKLVSVNPYGEETINGILTIPDGVTEISEDAFKHFERYGGPFNEEAKNYNINAIRKIILPESVEYIKDRAFKNVRKLNEINIPKNLKYIGNEAFYNCGLNNIYLNVGLEYIGERAFGCNCNLKKIYIPSTVEYIGNSPFYSSFFLNNITIDEYNKKYSDCKSNVIFNKDTKEILQGSTNSKIPEEAKIIAENAFFSIFNLRNIVIPGNIEELQDYAFWGCANLESIKLNDGLKLIGKHCFEECGSLKSITLPQTLKTIDENAIFSTGIENIEIKCDISIIKDTSISNNEELKTIYVNNIDKDLEFYNKYKDKIKIYSIEDLINQNKTLKEINKIYKETER